MLKFRDVEVQGRKSASHPTRRQKTKQLTDTLRSESEPFVEKTEDRRRHKKKAIIKRKTRWGNIERYTKWLTIRDSVGRKVEPGGAQNTRDLV